MFASNCAIIYAVYFQKDSYDYLSCNNMPVTCFVNDASYRVTLSVSLQ